MDLENLKNTWKEEEVKDLPEVSTEKQKQLHNPLEKIRRSMRIEFWSTTIAMVFYIAANFLIEDQRLRLYYLMLLVAMCAVTRFYFSKFFLLYKEMQNLGLNTKDSLKDLYYQLQLNQQYYVSYYIAYVPFLVCGTILIFEFMPAYQIYSGAKLFVVFLVILLLEIFTFFYLGKIMFNFFYGRYINDIYMVINEMSDEKLVDNGHLFKPKKENIYLVRIRNYFSKTFGKVGIVIYNIFFILVVILILMLFAFAVGFIIGFIDSVQQ